MYSRNTSLCLFLQLKLLIKYIQTGDIWEDGLKEVLVKMTNTRLESEGHINTDEIKPEYYEYVSYDYKICSNSLYK